MVKLDESRREENERRIASCRDRKYWFVDPDGVQRLATMEDHRNTLDALGFELDEEMNIQDGRT